MKVEILVETDVMDRDSKVVGTGTMTATLTDDHRIDPSDVVAVYDQIRHNFMVEMYEQGLYPTWDSPIMYGTAQRPSSDPRERTYPLTRVSEESGSVSLSGPGRGI